MWPSVLFAVFLVTTSCCLLLRHHYVWRASFREEVSEREREYFQRQCRRRIQASAMIGIVGLMIGGGFWVRGLLASAVYWSSAVVLVIWMGLLALADMIETRRYYHTVRKDQLAEHAALRAELRRLKRRDGNGRARLDAGEEDR